MICALCWYGGRAAHAVPDARIARRAIPTNTLIIHAHDNNHLVSSFTVIPTSGAAADSKSPWEATTLFWYRRLVCRQI